MGRQSNNTAAIGGIIMGFAFIWLVILIVPIMVLLNATQGTKWHKWVIMGLIGIGYFGYMDVVRVNKCMHYGEPKTGAPFVCPPPKLADYLPHDW
jgi:hypothetical protein